MSGRAHVLALGVLALAAVVHLGGWVVADRMPPGDFPGYVAEVGATRDALLEHARVPFWCAACYGGTTDFTAHAKEVAAFPLAVAVGPLLATKLLFALLKLAAAIGMYATVARLFGDPRVGVIAGYAYGFGAVANHQLEHLDVAVAAALAPAIFLAAVGLLRSGGAARALALGVLVACQLVNNWVHALPVPFAVLLLAAFRPWEEGSGTASPWRDPRLALRWAGRAAAALAVFAVFAGSQLAWIASDARNHRLIPAQTIDAARGVYVERSPFLFVNRANVLGPWLAEHHPPGVPVAAWDADRRYLGIVALAVCLGGGLTLRRASPLRRWALVAGLLLLLQYWLALGPRTLLWEVGESLHWAPQTQRLAGGGLRLGSAAALALAAFAWTRGRRSDAGRRRLRAGPAALAGLLLFFPTTSLWSLAARGVPVLEVQRSPGHYFDTATFAFDLLFAVSLVVLTRRLARPQRVRALLGIVAVALAFDFWPGRESFAAGEPLAPLRRAAAALEALPGDGGTLRIAQAPVYSPLASWVAAHAAAGHAWGWLPWRSGRHWEEFLRAAAWGADRGGARLASEPALLAVGRIRYFLLDAQTRGPRELAAPWRRVWAGERFSLWQQPEVAPMASGFHAYWLAEASAPTRAATVVRALAENALVVAASGAEPAALRDGAREILAPFALPGPSLPRQRPPAPPPFEVGYRRPRPERIVLELPAGREPAMVFVSEGYHPWWRARVDGEPAPVLRAQIAFLAVPTPPGSRVVELRLERPALVATADGVSGAAWAALALGAPVLAIARRCRPHRAGGA